MELLKKYRQKKGLLQKEVASFLGIDRTTYVKYETGASEPDFKTLNKLADLYGVTSDELIGRETDRRQVSNVFTVKKKKFPLLGEIACGQPIYADEQHESYVSASAEIDADFCLIAKGDSMINARIYDGDVVFIKAMPIVDNGDIAAIVIEDGTDSAEATLKRFYFYPESNTVNLIAENPRYAPIILTGDELNRVRVLGKAVSANILLR